MFSFVAFPLWTTSAHLSSSYSHLQTIPDESMFKKRRLTNSGATGSNADQHRCERIQRLPQSQSSDRCYDLPAKRQRVVDAAKILLDIAKESSDWFPPLKSALGGVSALTPPRADLRGGNQSDDSFAISRRIFATSTTLCLFAGRS